jgi:hypothetical protein
LRVTTSKKSRHGLTITYGWIGLSLLACSAREGDLFATAAGRASGSDAVTAGATSVAGNAGTGAAGDASAGGSGTSAGAPSGGAAGSITAGHAGNGGGSSGTTPSGGAGAGGVDGTGAGSGGIPGTAGDAGTAGLSGSGGVGQGGTSGTGGVSLDPTPGTYQRACDGSLGVRLGGDTFLSGSDEDQELRVYRRGADAPPIHRFDLSEALDLSDSDEADLEDAARIGDRVYVVGSHGRTSEGELDRSRFRFFAVDIGASGDELSLAVAGYTETLLDDLLATGNWDTPNPSVITAISTAAGLAEDENDDLTPDTSGATLEGLAQAGPALAPATLWLGFRNPIYEQRAIVVSLLNPDAVITGVTAHFGEATLLDLGGLGIRALSWSSFHVAVIVVAGPHAAGGPFRLFKWSGRATDQPTAIADLTALPSDSSPEAVITYPDSSDVQILFDQGEHVIGDDPCKDTSEEDRSFGDRIVHVP